MAGFRRAGHNYNCGERSIRVYRSNIFDQTLPIMLALCLMLLGTYYAQNYASIIVGCLNLTTWMWFK